MKSFCTISLSVLFVFCVFAALERPAYAYVDPGSSLLIYQSLSAMVAGAVFYLRRRIRSLFRTRGSQLVASGSAGEE